MERLARYTVLQTGVRVRSLNEKKPEEMDTPDPPICGLIMPISGMEGYPESHWKDVLDIISEAVEAAGMKANLVSYAEESGLIHTNIVQNLYDNALVICDVSGKNPNVMFELGLRLAFDRPTIIVKDDLTSYSFDTGVVEHLGYPRDLRFGKIVEFKSKLAGKMKATTEKAKSDPTYSTFLKHFKRVRVVKLQDQEVNGYDFLLDELSAMRRDIGRINKPTLASRVGNQQKKTNWESVTSYEFLLPDVLSSSVEEIVKELQEYEGITTVSPKVNGGTRSIRVDFDETAQTWVKEHVQNVAELLRNKSK